METQARTPEAGVHDANTAGSLQQRIIIDGQQRLTTLPILLDALHAQLLALIDGHTLTADFNR